MTRPLFESVDRPFDPRTIQLGPFAENYEWYLKGPYLEHETANEAGWRVYQDWLAEKVRRTLEALREEKGRALTVGLVGAGANAVKKELAAAIGEIGNCKKIVVLDISPNVARRAAANLITDGDLEPSRVIWGQADVTGGEAITLHKKVDTEVEVATSLDELVRIVEKLYKHRAEQFLSHMREEQPRVEKMGVRDRFRMNHSVFTHQGQTEQLDALLYLTVFGGVAAAVEATVWGMFHRFVRVEWEQGSLSNVQAHALYDRMRTALNGIVADFQTLSGINSFRRAYAAALAAGQQGSYLQFASVDDASALADGREYPRFYPQELKDALEADGFSVDVVRDGWWGDELNSDETAEPLLDGHPESEFPGHGHPMNAITVRKDF